MTMIPGSKFTFQSAKKGDECDEHDRLNVVHEVHRVFEAELAALHHRLRESPPDATQYSGREDDEEAEKVELYKRIHNSDAAIPIPTHVLVEPSCHCT